jgi:hypothetical protein
MRERASSDMRRSILRQSVTADCDTIYSIRKSIWFILAVVLVLAAWGSQEPDLTQDTRSSAVETPSAGDHPNPWTHASEHIHARPNANECAAALTTASDIHASSTAGHRVPSDSDQDTDPATCDHSFCANARCRPGKTFVERRPNNLRPRPIDVPARLSNTGDRRKHAHSDARNLGGGGVETYPTLDSCTNVGIRDAGHRSRRRYRTVRDWIHSCYRQNTGEGRLDSLCSK